jgi:uncharacterized protein YceH (UPF0502 family)
MLIETLTQEEARVLGTLAEKSLSTPDYYPMTLNSLRNACNQKSSRDPVTEYDDETVSQALAGLKRKVLVTFIPYGSQGNNYKYRHFLEDPRFNLHKADIAVLAVLLLRGSQTLNEVKLRASSLHPLATLEAAESVLASLADRPESLAERLPKRPGWKEPRWRDRVRPPLEEGRAEEGGTEESPEGTVTGMLPGDGSAAGRTQREEIEDLRREVSELKAVVSGLQAAVEKIKSELY